MNGNPNYDRYQKDIGIITTKLNLMELHYITLRINGKEEADKVFEEFLDFCADIDDEVIKQASELRFSLKKREVSYIDCIGYIIAKTKNIKFLTGDSAFEEMDNVEFVK